MRLYDGLIREALAALEHCEPGMSGGPRTLALGGPAWPRAERNELLLASDAALELGGGKRPAVALTLVTSDPGLFEPGRLGLYGPDLSELGPTAAFARVVLALADFSDVGATLGGDERARSDEDLYHAVKDLELAPYELRLQGCMSRLSALDHREELRVGKAALAQGLGLEALGNAYAEAYLAVPRARAVSVFLSSVDLPCLGLLSGLARRARDITMALNAVVSGMGSDCGSCRLKPLCDEVEGLRELHFGRRGTSS